jgi:hypothetical protein
VRFEENAVEGGGLGHDGRPRKQRGGGKWGSQLGNNRRKEGRGVWSGRCHIEKGGAAGDGAPAAARAGRRRSNMGRGRMAGGAPTQSWPGDSF